MNTPVSTLELAKEMIVQQEYLLNQQAELNRAVVRRNIQLVKAANECERENHKLRKELEGYKRGRIWTMFSSFLPTLSLGEVYPVSEPSPPPPKPESSNE